MIDFTGITAIATAEGNLAKIERKLQDGTLETLWEKVAANPFESYTGVYTAQRLTVDGAPYILYTLTGSGTLKLRGEARVWMNGGGANGGRGSGSTIFYGCSGYGGGGGFVASGELKSGEYTVTIGARQGTTSFVHTDGTKLDAAGASGKNGGSGGGGMARYSGNTSVSNAGGTGAGVSTYPFGITSLYAHSAGGAAGTYVHVTSSSAQYYRGGAGGSNGNGGGNGATSTTSSSNVASGSSGGTKGGGTGGGIASGAGDSVSEPGKSATFYGGGGGGGTTRTWYDGTGAAWRYAGDGYQGVAYVLIPDEGYELAA